MPVLIPRPSLAARSVLQHFATSRRALARSRDAATETRGSGASSPERGVYVRVAHASASEGQPGHEPLGVRGRNSGVGVLGLMMRVSLAQHVLGGGGRELRLVRGIAHA